MNQNLKRARPRPDRPVRARRRRAGIAYRQTPSTAPVGATLEIEVDKSGPTISPGFYGLMTEEINHSYDGGLYAELIQNRSFQDPQPRGRQEGALPIHWFVVGDGAAKTRSRRPGERRASREPEADALRRDSGSRQRRLLGRPRQAEHDLQSQLLRQGERRLLRPDHGVAYARRLRASRDFGDLKPVSGEWRKYSVTLKTGKSAPATTKARFVLSASGRGSVAFTQVSLFPPTYKNSQNGLRPDLMELMAGLKPSFIRLPGGNYLEGSTFETRFDWKKMIGPVDQRPGHMGCWGYRSSDGFGLPEYLRWCEQLGAEPILGVFRGLRPERSVQRGRKPGDGAVHPGGAGGDRVHHRPRHERVGAKSAPPTVSPSRSS